MEVNKPLWLATYADYYSSSALEDRPNLEIHNGVNRGSQRAISEFNLFVRFAFSPQIKVAWTVEEGLFESCPVPAIGLNC